MARPKKDENDLHGNRLSIYLTDDDYTLINQLAARKGIPAGVLGRAFIASQLDALSSSMSSSVLNKSSH